MTTRAIPNADPKKDLRVIWSGDGKTIVSDQRNKPPSSVITTPEPLSSPTTSSYTQQPQKPSRVPKPRRFIVKGPK